MPMYGQATTSYLHRVCDPYNMVVYTKPSGRTDDATRSTRQASLAISCLSGTLCIMSLVSNSKKLFILRQRIELCRPI